MIMIMIIIIIFIQENPVSVINTVIKGGPVIKIHKESWYKKSKR